MLNSRKLLLVDGVGAIVSALMLGVVLPMVQHLIGLPKGTLCFLALIAVVFACYSISAYLFLREKWKLFLRVIAIGNLFYCALTFAVVWFHFEMMELIGLLYFIGEIILVVGLATCELRVSYQK